MDDEENGSVGWFTWTMAEEDWDEVRGDAQTHYFMDGGSDKVGKWKKIFNVNGRYT